MCLLSNSKQFPADTPRADLSKKDTGVDATNSRAYSPILPAEEPWLDQTTRRSEFPLRALVQPQFELHHSKRSTSSPVASQVHSSHQQTYDKEQPSCSLLCFSFARDNRDNSTNA